jgi:hypothetical protein
VITTVMAIRGTTTSGPANSHTTPRNSTTKGMSATVSSVADVAKSRTLSNSRKVFANDPAEPGRWSSRNPITRRNSTELMTTSAFLPAMSVSQARSMRAPNSNTAAKPTPMANTHSVLYAWFGTTLSYTIMVNNDPAIVSTLTKTVATPTCQ